MKLVEKNCPSCGAGLKFNENDTSVTCEYCNKTYYLQKDEKKSVSLDNAHIGDAYKFVNEFGKPVLSGFKYVFMFPIIMFILVIGIFGFMSANMFKDNHNNIKDRYENMVNDNKTQDTNKDNQKENKTKYVSKIAEIDKVSMDTFHDSSKIKLKNYTGSCVHGDYTLTENWTSVGVYLLVSKEDGENILYDVLKHTYKNKKTGKKTTLYAAVKYDDLVLTEDGIVNNDYSGWSEAPSYEFPGTTFNSANGYESVEKLYNQLIRGQSGTYTIEGSEGLYIEG